MHDCFVLQQLLLPLSAHAILVPGVKNVPTYSVVESVRHV